MPDFDLRKSLNNGIRGLFIEIILVVTSIFIAFQWQKFINEAIETFFPQGHNLLEKFLLNILLTFILVGLAYLLLKAQKKPKHKHRKKP